MIEEDTWCQLLAFLTHRHTNTHTTIYLSHMYINKCFKTSKRNKWHTKVPREVALESADQQHPWAACRVCNVPWAPDMIQVVTFLSQEFKWLALRLAYGNKSLCLSVTLAGCPIPSLVPSPEPSCQLSCSSVQNHSKVNILVVEAADRDLRRWWFLVTNRRSGWSTGHKRSQKRLLGGINWTNTEK